MPPRVTPTLVTPLKIYTHVAYHLSKSNQGDDCQNALLKTKEQRQRKSYRGHAEKHFTAAAAASDCAHGVLVILHVVARYAILVQRLHETLIPHHHHQQQQQHYHRYHHHQHPSYRDVYPLVGGGKFPIPVSSFLFPVSPSLSPCPFPLQPLPFCCGEGLETAGEFKRFPSGASLNALFWVVTLYLTITKRGVNNSGVTKVGGTRCGN